jgi:two-component system OmpR family response regulator
MVLVLSAPGRGAERVEGLRRGADDYLPEAFGEVKLRALMRRARATDHDLMAFGDIAIRLEARTVHVGTRHGPVRPREFALVTVPARDAGAVVTRMQLLETSGPCIPIPGPTWWTCMRAARGAGWTRRRAGR